MMQLDQQTQEEYFKFRDEFDKLGEGDTPADALLRTGILLCRTAGKSRLETVLILLEAYRNQTNASIKELFEPGN